MNSKKVLIAQCSYLYNEFLNNNKKYKNVKYFRTSPVKHLIMFKIFEYYYQDEDLFVEKLIEYIPTSFASRANLFAFIDNAVKENILVKTESLKDHRKKTIKPSESFEKEFAEWIMSLKSSQYETLLQESKNK